MYDERDMGSGLGSIVRTDERPRLHLKATGIVSSATMTKMVSGYPYSDGSSHKGGHGR